MSKGDTRCPSEALKSINATSFFSDDCPTRPYEQNLKKILKNWRNYFFKVLPPVFFSSAAFEAESILLCELLNSRASRK